MMEMSRRKVFSKKMRRTQRGWLGYAITIIACIGLWVFAGYELFAWKGGYNYQTDTPVGHFDKDNQLCALTGPPLANQSMDYACTAANACFNGTFYEDGKALRKDFPGINCLI